MIRTVSRRKYSFCESLSLSLHLSLSFSLDRSFACSSDNFADRLSRFQQRDVVAFLNEEMGVRGRMLTVLFKLLTGRTKVLTTPYKGGVSSRFSRALLRDDFLPQIVGRALRRAGGDENFSLEGQDAVTRLWGIPERNFANYLSVHCRTRENDDDRRATVGARLCTSRINGLASRAGEN